MSADGEAEVVLTANVSTVGEWKRQRERSGREEARLHRGVSEEGGGAHWQAPPVVLQPIRQLPQRGQPLREHPFGHAHRQFVSVGA
jgi:hypothetical protein